MDEWQAGGMGAPTTIQDFSPPDVRSKLRSPLRCMQEYMDLNWAFSPLQSCSLRTFKSIRLRRIDTMISFLSYGKYEVPANTIKELSRGGRVWIWMIYDGVRSDWRRRARKPQGFSQGNGSSTLSFPRGCCRAIRAVLS